MNKGKIADGGEFKPEIQVRCQLFKIAEFVYVFDA
jgi:hypothetical protein